jgi:drug/metabolite transporter (DMT)-like permease
VILISVNPADLSLRGFFSMPMLIGLGSGALFGISAVSYRAASLSLDGGDFLIRASLTLAFVTVLQTLLMTVYLAWRETEEIGRVFASWRVTVWVGVTGMLGSLGWFTAMTLQNAAYVRALGQVELVFTFAASYLIFKERSTWREISGIILVVLGILLLLGAG